MNHSRGLGLLLLLLGMLASACSSDAGSDLATGPSATPPGMSAIGASVDLYTAAPQRVAFGLVMPDGTLVSFGKVRVDFAFVGSAAQPTEPEPGPSATATYIPTFGTPDRPGGPRITAPDEARGVYQASDVVFDRAGFWTATVTADIDGSGPQTAQTTFQVLEHPQLPAPGDRAQPTENLTVASDAPEAAIDSRAATTGKIPDPGLHRTTIAQAIAEGRPALVVFATPVYCVSRFCGPVTDMVQELSHRYRDRAEFIHVEIWEDFQNQALNQAAIDWLLLPSGDLSEPWLFLIGADGRIVDRWSALWSEREVARALEALPPIPPGSSGG